MLAAVLLGACAQPIDADAAQRWARRHETTLASLELQLGRLLARLPSLPGDTFACRDITVPPGLPEADQERLRKDLCRQREALWHADRHEAENELGTAWLNSTIQSYGVVGVELVIAGPPAGAAGAEAAGGVEGANAHNPADGSTAADGADAADAADGSNAAEGTNAFSGPDGADPAEGITAAEGTNAAEGPNAAEGADAAEGATGAAAVEWADHRGLWQLGGAQPVRAADGVDYGGARLGWGEVEVGLASANPAVAAPQLRPALEWQLTKPWHRATVTARVILLADGTPDAEFLQQAVGVP